MAGSSGSSCVSASQSSFPKGMLLPPKRRMCRRHNTTWRLTHNQVGLLRTLRRTFHSHPDPAPSKGARLVQRVPVSRHANRVVVGIPPSTVTPRHPPSSPRKRGSSALFSRFTFVCEGRWIPAFAGTKQEARHQWAKELSDSNSESRLLGKAGYVRRWARATALPG